MEIRSDSEQYSDDSCEDNELVGSPQIFERLERLHEEERLVNEETHPELRKKFEIIEAELNQRKFFNRSCFKMEMERINRWKETAMELVRLEAERQQQELQESLMSELDEKKRMLDVEKASMDLSVSGDVFDSKPTTTRKLRRRLHDNNNSGTSTTVCSTNNATEPLGLSAKRKKVPSNNHTDGIKYLLDEDDITADLVEIFRITGRPIGNTGSGQKRSSSSVLGADDGLGLTSGMGGSGDEPSVYIDDGRLYYDHKWFTKGQPVLLLGKDAAQHKFSAIITHVGMQEVHLKRQTDLGKVKVNLQQLKSGKCVLRKRN